MSINIYISVRKFNDLVQEGNDLETLYFIALKHGYYTDINVNDLDYNKLCDLKDEYNNNILYYQFKNNIYHKKFIKNFSLLTNINNDKETAFVFLRKYGVLNYVFETINEDIYKLKKSHVKYFMHDYLYFLVSEIIKIENYDDYIQDCKGLNIYKDDNSYIKEEREIEFKYNYDKILNKPGNSHSHVESYYHKMYKSFNHTYNNNIEIYIIIITKLYENKNEYIDLIAESIKYVFYKTTKKVKKYIFNQIYKKINTFDNIMENFKLSIQCKMLEFMFDVCKNFKTDIDIPEKDYIYFTK